MKHTQRSIINISVAAAVMASYVFAPAVLGASPAAGNKGQDAHTTAVANAFCASLSGLSGRFHSDANNEISKLQDKVDNEAQKVQQNRQTVDSKVSQARDAATSEREGVYATLDEKAATDAQKQAVATFKAAVEAASSTRETAIKQAQATYRQGLDQIVAQHRSAVHDTLAAYKDAIASAIQQAQAQCSAGQLDAVTIRADFQQALQTARANRQSQTTQIDKVGPQVRALAQTRNAAVQRALQTYKTALQAAVAQLKAAFGETNGSSAT